MPPFSKLGLGGYARGLFSTLSAYVAALLGLRWTDRSAIRYRISDRSGLVGPRKHLNRFADFEVEIFVERKNGASGRWEPATGLLLLNARIAASKNGAGLIDVDLAERGTTALYFGILDAPDLEIALAAVSGVNCSYLIFSKASDFDACYVPIIVVDALRV